MHELELLTLRVKLLMHGTNPLKDKIFWCSVAKTEILLMSIFISPHVIHLFKLLLVLLIRYDSKSLIKRSTLSLGDL